VMPSLPPSCGVYLPRSEVWCGLVTRQTTLQSRLSAKRGPFRNGGASTLPISAPSCCSGHGRAPWRFLRKDFGARNCESRLPGSQWKWATAGYESPDPGVLLRTRTMRSLHRLTLENCPNRPCLKFSVLRK
jgi:hypothetical protein